VSTNTLPVAVLAGGLGTRLYPVTEAIPKSLVEVGGEPFVAHQMRLLKANGVREVVMCVGVLAEMIQDYLGDGSRFGVRVQYSFDGPVRRGTGGAILQALPLLGDAFFVLYGDSYLPCDYRKVERAFQDSGRLGLMTLYRNEGQWDSSNVEFAEGRIVTYDKKNRTPRMQYIDYGLGVFRKEAFGAPRESNFDLAELYQSLLARNELAGLDVPERFYEVGSFEGIRDLTEYLAVKDRSENTNAVCTSVPR